MTNKVIESLQEERVGSVEHVEARYVVRITKPGCPLRAEVQ